MTFPSPSPSHRKSLKLKISQNKVFRYTSRVTKNTFSHVTTPAAAMLLLQCWVRQSRSTNMQFTLEFHHLSRVGPNQLFVSKPRKYSRSGYSLVSDICIVYVFYLQLCLFPTKIENNLQDLKIFYNKDLKFLCL